MVFARRRQGRCFPLKHWRCRRGEFNHGVFAACKREFAGSRVYSSQSADAITSANREPTSQAITQQIERLSILTQLAEPRTPDTTPPTTLGEFSRNVLVSALKR